MNNAAEIMVDERTIYNYIDAGILSAGNIDLPRKVVIKNANPKRLYVSIKNAISGVPTKILKLYERTS